MYIHNKTWRTTLKYFINSICDSKVKEDTGCGGNCQNASNWSTRGWPFVHMLFFLLRYLLKQTLKEK